jgi:hypothetical protein
MATLAAKYIIGKPGGGPTQHKGSRTRELRAPVAWGVAVRQNDSENAQKALKGRSGAKICP